MRLSRAAVSGISLCLLAFQSFAWATKDAEPGQVTIWDQIMEAQSYREMQAGSGYMQDHDYEKAVKEFAKAVIKSPKDSNAHLMLGTAYYWTGQVDQSVSEFQEALKLDPKSDQAHLLMGIARAWKGETQIAYESFIAAEKINPNRADVEMDLGSIEETLGKFPQALDHFRKAVALEPSNPLYHFQLGTLYSRLGRDGDAVDSLKLALKNYPEFEDAMLELGAAYERLGQKQDAMEMFAKAVRLKPRDSVARLRLTREYLLLNDVQKAREISRDAFHLTPDEPGGGLALSVSFGGKPKEGAASPSENPQESPPQPANPNDPLDMLARNLERIPLNQEAKLNIEMAFMPRPKLEREKPHELGSNLKRALEEAGKPPPRPNPMGVKREYVLPASSMANRQERIKKLLDDLRETMKQAPPDAETRMAMNLSFNSSKNSSGPPSGDSDQPKVSYQPRQVGNDLGLWVQGTGWMSLVEEVLPETGEAPTHPQQADWWVTDGLAYAALGNGEMSLSAFLKALELDAKDETALLGRSVALVELGREAEAIAAYRRLLEIYPKNKTAREGLAWLMRAPVSSGSSAGTKK